MPAACRRTDQMPGRTSAERPTRPRRRTRRSRTTRSSCRPPTLRSPATASACAARRPHAPQWLPSPASPLLLFAARYHTVRTEHVGANHRIARQDMANWSKTRFFDAVRSWQAADVRAALRERPELATACDSSGRPPLHVCARRPLASPAEACASIVTAQALLDAGTDVNVVQPIPDDGEVFPARLAIVRSAEEFRSTSSTST